MWLKIKVWTKIIIASLLALYLLIFVLKNTSYEAEFWWWFNRPTHGTVFTLAFLAFVSGALCTILIRTTWRTYTQIRELQKRSKQNRMERDLADMKSKAGMLQTRESTPAETEPDQHVENE